MTAPRYARLVVMLALAVQFGVPVWQLSRPRPARFGWQMFSERPPAPLVIAIRASGARDTLHIDDYFAFRRGDLNPSYVDRIPGHLCRALPGLEAIVMHRGARAPAETHRCD